MADYKDFDHTQYGSGKIYPLQNALKKGYGVADPDVNPAGKEANGRFVNQRNEKIDFWVEELTANFGMTGTTAQSRNVRQFMPHNITQPSITVKGRAPNSFQYNRMATFVRASHFAALNPGQAEVTRHLNTTSGQTVPADTVRFVLFNGSGAYPYNGKRKPNGRRQVKGVHVAWAVEGYIKSMKAGAQRFNQAPPFQFEFFVSETQFHGNLSMWNDSRVYGSELLPWLDWIKKGSGEFVTVQEQKASKNTLDNEKGKQKANNDVPTVNEVFEPIPSWVSGDEVYGPPAP